ncbi:hypothetical protein HanIR_Chr09g0437911 [Helianthus annuus]|nr:hypothetical protein HanIR_Chr09g0437911 [Helianthus annuus]
MGHGKGTARPGAGPEHRPPVVHPVFPVLQPTPKPGHLFTHTSYIHIYIYIFSPILHPLGPSPLGPSSLPVTWRVTWRPILPTPYLPVLNHFGFNYGGGPCNSFKHHLNGKS